MKNYRWTQFIQPGLKSLPWPAQHVPHHWIHWYLPVPHAISLTSSDDPSWVYEVRLPWGNHKSPWATPCLYQVFWHPDALPATSQPSWICTVYSSPKVGNLIILKVPGQIPSWSLWMYLPSCGVFSCELPLSLLIGCPEPSLCELWRWATTQMRCTDNMVSVVNYICLSTCTHVGVSPNWCNNHLRCFPQTRVHPSFFNASPDSTIYTLIPFIQTLIVWHACASFACKVRVKHGHGFIQRDVLFGTIFRRSLSADLRALSSTSGMVPVLSDKIVNLLPDGVIWCDLYPVFLRAYRAYS